SPLGDRDSKGSRSPDVAAARSSGMFMILPPPSVTRFASRTTCWLRARLARVICQYLLVDGRQVRAVHHVAFEAPGYGRTDAKPRKANLAKFETGWGP